MSDFDNDDVEEDTRSYREKDLERQNHDLVVSSNKLLRRSRLAEWRIMLTEALLKKVNAAIRGPIWEHKNRGSVYTVMGPARAQTSTAIRDNESVVVYFDKSGELWVRSSSEFYDGRYTCHHSTAITEYSKDGFPTTKNV